MTNFLDGPAKGQALMLKRTPIFLRVTEENGKFDALNDIGDTPRKTETLYVYIVAAYKGNVHINRGRNGSGFFPVVDYKLCSKQPTDAQMREDIAWAMWVEENKDLAAHIKNIH